MYVYNFFYTPTATSLEEVQYHQLLLHMAGTFWYQLTFVPLFLLKLFAKNYIQLQVGTKCYVR